jgi:UDP-glucose 4-epimerase
MVPYDQIAGRKYEDVPRRIPDIEKAKQKLGFEAKISLEEGLRKTIEWQRPFVLDAEARGRDEAQILTGATRG